MVMKRIASQSRQLTFSLKMNNAIRLVATISKFPSSEALAVMLDAEKVNASDANARSHVKQPR